MANRYGWSAILVLAAQGLPSLASAQAPSSPGAETAPPPEPPTEAPSSPAPPPPPPPAAEPAPPPPPPASTAMLPVASPLRIEGKDGSIRLGLLLQPTYEALGSATADGLNNNLYLRRTRFMVGGTLFGHFEYFVETDYPNLFKANAEGMKQSPGLNIQDAFATYKPLADQIKLDAGFMLPPLAHNALQGATTLYSWDYFSNSFRSSDVFHSLTPSPVGRDLGAQLRGLLLDGHVEYRVGMFQGLRNAPVAAMAPANAQVGGQNFFRVAARVQINLLDPETGFFYNGTYLGAKRILSVGGSYDFQDNYKYWAVDAFLDMPLGPGVVTAQVNVAQWDGGTFITPVAPATAIPLPKQTAIMAEAGYLIAPIMFSPIVRFENRTYASSPTAPPPDETRYCGGVAFWPFGHNSNVKAFYTRIEPGSPDHGYNQFDLQWQLFFY